jgi:hypothetical protein
VGDGDLYQISGQEPPIPLGSPLETEAETDLKRFLSAVNTEFGARSPDEATDGFADVKTA